MTHTRSMYAGLVALFFLVTVTGCSLTREDVGPYQGDRQTFALTGFDRLDMGSSFGIAVQQGATFSITAEGDRRNLDDLDLYVRNGTLYARYRTARNRKYDTQFTITMPTLRGVDFSGASRSTVTGFTGLSRLDITLSGASEAQVTGQASQTRIELSGASELRITGNGTDVAADLSGASELDAFGYPVSTAVLDVSGASKASVNVADKLDVEASGASHVRYMGGPVIRQKTSGASKIEQR